MEEGDWPVGRKIYQGSKEARNRGRGRNMYECVVAQLVNTNGDIGDHSHMNAFPLHSQLSVNFLERFSFPIFLFELYLKNSKVQGNVENAQDNSGAGSSHHRRIWWIKKVVPPVISLFLTEKEGQLFCETMLGCKRRQSPVASLWFRFYSQVFLQRYKCLKSYPWHIIHLFANNFTQKIVTIV